MSEKLDELFNMASETSKTMESKKEVVVSENLPVLSSQTMDSLIDIYSHEKDMDQIAETAMAGYEEIMDFARQAEERNTAVIAQAAVTMLKNAIDAKESKLKAKLQAAALLLRKEAADEKKALKNANVVDEEEGQVDEGLITGDRNKILGVINNIENNK